MMEWSSGFMATVCKTVYSRVRIPVPSHIQLFIRVLRCRSLAIPALSLYWSISAETPIGLRSFYKRNVILDTDIRRSEGNDEGQVVR